MAGFAPTVEQQRALSLFQTGENLIIQAGAGTGKTSTLRLLAASAPKRRGQYIAFNRAIVKEAGQKFPGSVNCSTAHALAFRAVGKDYADRIHSSSRMRSIDIANVLGINAIKVTTYAGEAKLLSQSFLAGLAMRAAVRFCQSADETPTIYSVPAIPGLDAPERGRGPVNHAVAKALIPAVRRIWSDWTSLEGSLPYRHDAYLKLWQTSDPKIGADYILFDEAQDANPVMAAIVLAQTHAQLVFVGDSQQQIYAFTGAVNALANLPEANTAFLTQSFRFGQAIADVANSVLSTIESAQLRLTGFQDINSVVGPVDEPDVILTRTNAAAIRYFLQGMQAGKRVHIVGGTDEFIKFAKAAQSLMRGDRTDHVDLACFETWREVEQYVEEDEQGGDLRLMVKIIADFGVETILTELAQSAKEDDADLIVSTAHKSKGREWDAVQLGSDFPETINGDDEKRLLYVAVTRARRALDIDAVFFLSENYVPEEPQQAPVVTTGGHLAEEESPAQVEEVVAPVSEHVGAPGQGLTLTLRCEHSHGMTTRYGWTHLTKLVDAEGNQFKAFIDDELEAGTWYALLVKVKGHGEFRGVKETTIKIVKVVDEVTV